MKNQQQFLDLKLSLPEEFATTLEEAMEDEFLIACRKWGISLTEEEKAKVFHHAKLQLEGKVYNSCHHRWTYGTTLLVVGVRRPTEEDQEGEVTLPQEGTDAPLIVRSNNEWKLDDDPSDEAVPLSSFYDYFLLLLEQWLRTAVFYGVGSYGQ